MRLSPTIGYVMVRMGHESSRLGLVIRDMTTAVTPFSSSAAPATPKAQLPAFA
jgi:hypothetical protein